MPTRHSSLYDKKEKYVTMDYCSDNLSEGMLERLDDWSQYEQFQQGCWELIQIFSAWETSKNIREEPEKHWSFLKNPKHFELRQGEELRRRTNASNKLNTLISQIQVETENNWKAIVRDSYFRTEEN